MILLETIESFINKKHLVENGDNVLVGVSGGADSVCLLHILRELTRSYKLQLVVAHINHQLRGRESDGDEKFLESLCKKWKIRFESKTFPVKDLKKSGKSSIEEIGREIRYKYFQELAEKYQCSKIAIAHHADDQVETVLMRFIRGTGADGLAGMQPIRPLFREQSLKGHPVSQNMIYLIRPLLGVTRTEILEYLKTHRLSYREDSSNQNTNYLRNKIRNDLIPQFKKEYNPQFGVGLLRMADILAAEEEFWEYFIQYFLNSQDFKNSENAFQYPIEQFKKSPVALQRRLLRFAIEHTQGHLRQIEYSHIEGILEMIGTQGNMKTIQLPGTLQVSVKNGFLLVCSKAKILPDKQGKYKIKSNGTTRLPSWNIKINIHSSKLIPALRDQIMKGQVPQNRAYVDADIIKLPLYVRSWLEGDSFIPLGMKGQKKLQDLFIDRKIPLEKRNQIPVLVDKNGILWVMGIQMSDMGKVSKATQKILKIEYSFLN